LAPIIKVLEAESELAALVARTVVVGLALDALKDLLVAEAVSYAVDVRDAVDCLTAATDTALSFAALGSISSAFRGVVRALSLVAIPAGAAVIRVGA